MPFSDTNPLVSAEWLQKHMYDENIVILDCRWRLTDPMFGPSAYTTSHIPNARYMDMMFDLSGPQAHYGGRHPLPTPKQFQNSLQSHGINASSHVICYDDDGSGAARCWWLLQFYGHRQVSVLQGGFDHWTTLGLPLTHVVKSVAPGGFKPYPDPRMIVDFQTVHTLLGAHPLIDARASERFHGDVEPIDAKAGHIPGAENIPYVLMFDKPLWYRNAPELKDLFTPVLHDIPHPIIYCGSGVSACVNVLALRIAGLHPLLYPGSWSDWIQHHNAPIEPH